MASDAGAPAGGGAPLAGLNTEVPAAPATSCWKCHGAGRVTRWVKVRSLAGTGEADGASRSPHREATVTLETCPICGGSGTLKRRRREADGGDATALRPRPVKQWPGWVAPGPSIPPLPPAGTSPEADPRALHPGEEHCSLAGHWRIIQRIASHRYSTDDVVTAWVAWRAASRLVGGLSRPMRCCDIGCGIGSVLLMTAWLRPTAVCLGVEAQAIRAATAVRSIAVNGVGDRVTVRNGDLRDPSTISDAELAGMGGGFDLVTGTPPYFEVTGSSALPADEEASRCLFEYRGGIEAYAVAAARLLHPDHGVFVVCESALAIDRGYTAAALAGLRVAARLDCVSKEGKEPLFVVFVMVTPKPSGAAAVEAAGGETGAAPAAATGAAAPAAVASSSPLPPAAAAAVTVSLPALRSDAFTPHGRCPYTSTAGEADGGAGGASGGAGAGSDSVGEGESSMDGSEEDGSGGSGGSPTAPAASGAGGGIGGRGKQRMGPVAAARRAARLARVFGARGDEAIVSVTVRDAGGRHTHEYHRLLAEMGKPG